MQCHGTLAFMNSQSHTYTYVHMYVPPNMVMCWGDMKDIVTTQFYMNKLMYQCDGAKLYKVGCNTVHLGIHIPPDMVTATRKRLGHTQLYLI